MQTHRSGFTLVELLIVISIIAILAGLAFPALNGALDAAKKAQAATMISNLKTAITAYNTEYGVWPYDDDKGKLTPETAYILLSPIGANKDKVASLPSTAQNSRQIVFMEFQNKDLDNTTNPTKFVTPWSKPSLVLDYSIFVDQDYDNQIIDIPDTSSTTSATVTLNAGVAIWCTGKPVKGAANTKANQFIRSW